MPKRYRPYSKYTPNKKSRHPDTGNHFCLPSGPAECNTNHITSNVLLFEDLQPAKQDVNEVGWSKIYNSTDFYMRWPLYGKLYYTNNPFANILRTNEQFFKKKLIKFHHSIKVRYYRNPGSVINEKYFEPKSWPILENTKATDFNEFTVSHMDDETIKVHMYLLKYKGFKPTTTPFEIHEIFTKPHDIMNSGFCEAFTIMAQKKYEHCIKPCTNVQTYSLTWNGNEDVCLYTAKSATSDESVFTDHNYLEIILYHDSDIHFTRKWWIAGKGVISDGKDNNGKYNEVFPGLVYHNHEYYEWVDLIKPGYTQPKIITTPIYATAGCHDDCNIVYGFNRDKNLPFTGQSCTNNNSNQTNDEDEEENMLSNPEPDASDNNQLVIANNKQQKPKKKSVFFG